eukprot:TRINITY_DN7059_c0_g1_i1.p2 TRINITY_DN7059_c0_g1~~TRINITY_DN7059_c0_g1_i1.p2  ORF type:complete len:197 (+),score=41.98 TRINITY_DN7059_c0_g1_i1:37-591(+)
MSLTGSFFRAARVTPRASRFSVVSRDISIATPQPPIELKSTSSKREVINTNDLFNNRKVLLVGIVGAFTGVCDNQIPPFAKHLKEFKDKGIDEIAVVSVNDPPVMKAFEKSLNLPADSITFLSDFDGKLTRSLDMEIDLTAGRLGKRSKRYALLVENGKVTKTFVEDKPGELKISSADAVLRDL